MDNNNNSNNSNKKKRKKNKQKYNSSNSNSNSSGIGNISNSNSSNGNGNSNSNSSVNNNNNNNNSFNKNKKKKNNNSNSFSHNSKYIDTPPLVSVSLINKSGGDINNKNDSGRKTPPLLMLNTNSSLPNLNENSSSSFTASTASPSLNRIVTNTPNTTTTTTTTTTASSSSSNFVKNSKTTTTNTQPQVREYAGYYYDVEKDRYFKITKEFQKMLTEKKKKEKELSEIPIKLNQTNCNNNKHNNSRNKNNLLELLKSREIMMDDNGFNNKIKNIMVKDHFKKYIDIPCNLSVSNTSLFGDYNLNQVYSTNDNYNHNSNNNNFNSNHNHNQNQNQNQNNSTSNYQDINNNNSNVYNNSNNNNNIVTKGIISSNNTFLNIDWLKIFQINNNNENSNKSSGGNLNTFFSNEKLEFEQEYKISKYHTLSIDLYSNITSINVNKNTPNLISVTTLGDHQREGTANFYKIDSLSYDIKLLDQLFLSRSTIWCSKWCPINNSNSNNSNIVSVGGSSGKLLIYDLNCQKSYNSILSKSDILAQEFNRYGNILFNGSRDGFVRMLDVRIKSNSNNNSSSINLNFQKDNNINNGNSISSISSLFDDNYLIISSLNGTISKWDRRLNKKVIDYPFNCNSHLKLGFTLSPDEQFISAAGDDKFIRIWNTSTGLLLKTIGPFEKSSTGLEFIDYFDSFNSNHFNNLNNNTQHNNNVNINRNRINNNSTQNNSNNIINSTPIYNPTLFFNNNNHFSFYTIL